MLKEIVTGRLNMLAVQALIDDRARQLRVRWMKILRKLEAMDGGGK